MHMASIFEAVQMPNWIYTFWRPLGLASLVALSTCFPCQTQVYASGGSQRGQKQIGVGAAS